MFWDTKLIRSTVLTGWVYSNSTVQFYGADLSQGGVVGYSLYSSFNTTVRAAHFVFLPFLPPSAEDIAAKNITLSDVQKLAQQQTTAWATTGNGYFLEQTTKVCSVCCTSSGFITFHTAQRHWIGPVRQSCGAARMDRRQIQAMCVLHPPT